MTDLIDRQEAIGVLKERLQANGYSNVALVSELNRSIGYLMHLPSAQPERKTGRWLHTDDMYEVPFCSECKWESMDYFEFNFCPNCGARMVKDE